MSKTFQGYLLDPNGEALTGKLRFTALASDSSTDLLEDSQYIYQLVDSGSYNYSFTLIDGSYKVDYADNDGRWEFYGNIVVTSSVSADLLAVLGLEDLSTPTTLALDDLTDINAESPTNGQVLTWNSATSKWVAADSAGGGSSSNSFATIAVSGQSDVVADSSTDTLTLAAGSNVTLTTNASTDTITIASASDMAASVYDALSKAEQILTVGDLVDEDDMASDSVIKVPSQQSVKAYVDANAGGVSGELNALDDTILLLTAQTEGTLSSRAINTSDLKAAFESASQLEINMMQSGSGVVYIDGYETLFSNSIDSIKGFSKKLKLRVNTQVTTGTVSISDSSGDLLVTFSDAHGLTANNKIFMNASSGSDMYGGTMPGNVAVNELLYVKDAPTTTTIRLAKTSGGAAVAYSSTGSGNITVFRPPVTTMHLDRAYVTSSDTAPAITSAASARWSYLHDVVSQANISETIDGTPTYFKRLTIAGTSAATEIKSGDVVKITSNDPQRTGVVQSTGRLTVSSLDTGTDVVTTSASHGLSTGDLVWFEIAGSDANYPVCTPTITTFKIAYARSVTATTLKLYQTAADADADTNAYDFTAGITGGDTMYINRAAYWNGVIVTVHEVTISGSDTLVKVNQFSEIIETDVKIAGYDMTFNPRLENFDIDYEFYQMFAAAANNWPDSSYGLKPDVIRVLGAYRPKDIDVGSRFGIGSGIRYMGCAFPFSFVPDSELGVNQEGTTYPQGDYDTGDYPSNAATAYNRALTACGAAIVIGSFGVTNRHSPISTEPMFLYPDVDPCLAGRDYPVSSGGNIVMGQAKDSGDDDHTNAMTNFRHVIAMHNGGNAVNRRSSGEIWLNSIDNVRDGQFTATRESPIEVFLHLQSINSGIVEVKDYATVHVYGFKSGTRAGATSNTMFNTTNSTATLILHDPMIECDDINTDGIFLCTAGRIVGSATLKPMPKLIAAREVAAQGGGSLGDHFANAYALQLILGGGGSVSLSLNLEGKGWTTARTSGSGAIPENTGVFYVESGEGGGAFNNMAIVEKNATTLPYQPTPYANALTKTESVNDTSPEYQKLVKVIEASFTGAGGSRVITTFPNSEAGVPFLYKITSGASSAKLDFSNSSGTSTLIEVTGSTTDHTFSGSTGSVYVIPDGTNHLCLLIDR